jgi:hypothetical protein
MDPQNLRARALEARGPGANRLPGGGLDGHDDRLAGAAPASSSSAVDFSLALPVLRRRRRELHLARLRRHHGRPGDAVGTDRERHDLRVHRVVQGLRLAAGGQAHDPTLAGGAGEHAAVGQQRERAHVGVVAVPQHVALALGR